MSEGARAGRIRNAVIGAAVTAALTLGSGISAWSWMPQDRPQSTTAVSTQDRSYSARINPDGSCELVDANGIPLYDSQFSQRTGSSPCDQG